MLFLSGVMLMRPVCAHSSVLSGTATTSPQQFMSVQGERPLTDVEKHSYTQVCLLFLREKGAGT